MKINVLIIWLFSSFAVSCGNGPTDICECKPNYGGERCEDCAAGYYGEPETIGKLYKSNSL